MKFQLVEESKFDRTKYHKRKQKGLSPFCYLNPDAGDVEKTTAIFNKNNTANPVSDSSSNDGSSESAAGGE